MNDFNPKTPYDDPLPERPYNYTLWKDLLLTILFVVFVCTCVILLPEVFS